MKIFCDFDGTVARNDVGDRFFQHFCRDVWEEMNGAWRAGSLSTQECYLRECAAVRATPEEVNRLIDGETIDPTFPAFVEFFRDQGVETLVLSDGVDYYIQRILKKHGLGHIRFYANHLVFDADRRVHLEFPYADPACRLCASCKGSNMRRELAPEERSVFVGDGLSDRCAAKTADILFAKDDLVPWCTEQAIPFYTYRDFADVQEALYSMNLLELQQGV